MKTFIGFIISVAVVAFCFFYYASGEFRRPAVSEMAAVAGEVRTEMAQAAAPVVSVRASNSVTIIAQRGKWSADTVQYMKGGTFFQQVLIKFSNGVVIEHTDGNGDNQFYLLNRESFTTAPGANRIFVVLDSLDGKLVWREIVRDGKGIRDDLDTLRIRFLLLRRPQSL